MERKSSLRLVKKYWYRPLETYISPASIENHTIILGIGTYNAIFFTYFTRERLPTLYNEIVSILFHY